MGTCVLELAVGGTFGTLLAYSQSGALGPTETIKYQHQPYPTVWFSEASMPVKSKLLSEGSRSPHATL